MKILITGGRNFNDKNLMYNTLKKYINNDDTVLHGGAKGVDTIANNYCNEFNIKTEIFLPQYELWGKVAPLIRNTEMVKKCDMVLAFWDGVSKGTKYTIDSASKYNKKTNIFYY